jgi:hypothetical protein
MLTPESDTYVHIYIIIIQTTAIKYDITFTMLFLFISSNVFPHDITKNEKSSKVLFVFGNFGKFVKPRWRRSIFLAKAWSLSFERFSS